MWPGGIITVLAVTVIPLYRKRFFRRSSLCKLYWVVVLKVQKLLLVIRILPEKLVERLAFCGPMRRWSPWQCSDFYWRTACRYVQDVFVGGRHLGSLKAHPLSRHWRETVQGGVMISVNWLPRGGMTSLTVRLVSARCGFFPLEVGRRASEGDRRAFW